MFLFLFQFLYSMFKFLNLLWVVFFKDRNVSSSFDFKLEDQIIVVWNVLSSTLLKKRTPHVNGVKFLHLTPLHSTCPLVTFWAWARLEIVELVAIAEWFWLLNKIIVLWIEIIHLCLVVWGFVRINGNVFIPFSFWIVGTVPS